MKLLHNYTCGTNQVGFYLKLQSELTTELKWVLITPGAIQLTLILSEASSLARALVSPNRAVLLTEYGPSACTHVTFGEDTVKQ